MKVVNVMRLFCFIALLLIVPCLAQAAFESGSTGADGPFEPTASVAVQIPEGGVFNYTTVTIPTGVTVTYKKNSQNTPVTILATGDVAINGAISVNASTGNYLIPGVGGPGGFDGGQGGVVKQVGKRGEGPGGGSGGGARSDSTIGGGGGDGGGFGTSGGQGLYSYTSNIGSPGVIYGNERLIPLIGGSGGGGGGGTSTYVGGSGGGGGSILIASSGTITVGGAITANAGTGAVGEYSSGYGGGGGGGSGGSIRLIANTLSGNGTITAAGGAGASSYGSYGNGGGGGAGRIRFEASNVLRTTSTTPPMSLGYPYAVAPPNMPSLTISSIGGQDVPSVPKGAYGSPDVMLPFNTQNPITVVVTGANIPTGQTVTVKASPSVGSTTSVSGTLSGTDTSSSATVSLSIATAYPSLITSSVTFQVAALNGAGPIYAAGEKVEFVRVAANLGGRSTVTYITASGKEVPAVL
ncbi:MAG: hypothetical protein PHP95_14415 [Desulfuromonadaceae bacterium]|nr:hypothetical protein [Desulfuromonadaceae bacterium]MDD2849643.1 hypothetical protein [Desulfuromonadaceae bacterium]MDD4131685.1 hypothetical protein [Desulfuromonadaceae bacterium]